MEKKEKLKPYQRDGEPLEQAESAHWAHDMTIRSNNQLGDSGLYDEAGEADPETGAPTP